MLSQYSGVSANHGERFFQKERQCTIYLCSQPLTKCHSQLGWQVMGAGYPQTYTRSPISVWRSLRNGRFMGEGWSWQLEIARWVYSEQLYVFQVQPGHTTGYYIQQNVPNVGLTEGEGSTNSHSPPSPTTSGSSELDAASNMFSAGSEDTKEWDSEFSRSPEPVKEDWESETPFSNWKLVHLVCSICICHLFGIYTVFM